MNNPTTWILVANGSTAKVLSFTGPGKPFEAVEGMSFTAPPKKEFSDYQGRSHDRFGSARHKHETHHSQDDEFARELVQNLERSVEKNSVERLVLCASPDILGQLRTLAGTRVKARIYAELSKDLVKTPVQDLPSHFKEILPT